MITQYEAALVDLDNGQATLNDVRIALLYIVRADCNYDMNQFKEWEELQTELMQSKTTNDEWLL